MFAEVVENRFLKVQAAFGVFQGWQWRFIPGFVRYLLCCIRILEFCQQFCVLYLPLITIGLKTEICYFCSVFGARAEFVKL